MHWLLLKVSASNIILNVKIILIQLLPNDKSNPSERGFKMKISVVSFAFQYAVMLRLNINRTLKRKIKTHRFRYVFTTILFLTRSHNKTLRVHFFGKIPKWIIDLLVSFL